MNTSNITGCCNGTNHYNLGGAHGVHTAPDLATFKDRIFALGHTSLNIAITNEDQRKTREYLEACGYETRAVGPLWLSSISGSDFRRNAEAWRLEKTALLKKKQEENALKQQQNASSIGTSTKIGFPEVRLADIQRIVIANGGGLNTWDPIGNMAVRRAVWEICEREYGVRLPDFSNIRRPGIRNWTTETLHRSIVQRVHNG